jgi:UDP-N-acetylmuramoyl-L-alanyl-D-glutamate--2,6-diaminopimelate ligase
VTLGIRPRFVTPISLARLAEVAAGAGPVRVEGSDKGVEVTGVCLRSADVAPGDLYAALPGARTHGAHYGRGAARAGAAAILTDAAGADLVAPIGLPTLVVGSPRAVLGDVSATVYGRPAESLVMVGVTGTQGKTTTTHLLHGALQAAGQRAAVVGTMGTWIGDDRMGTALTTPEAPDLHALFAVMREREVGVCAMEVSSHALVLGRVDGIVFDIAVFLNFGRDHLDFHPDVESYFAAKASLFRPDRARRGLLNADDPAIAAWRPDVEIPVHTFGTGPGVAADWRADDIALDPTGSDFTLRGPRGPDTRVRVQMAGAYNVVNATAALAAAAEAGVSLADTAAGLGTVPGVAGRLETVDAGQPFAVVVDYAHKPDAVRAVLATLRPVTDGRLWIVLGAGGDRDTGKRALMGAVAGSLADVVVVTDDNPRREDPATIRSAIVAGVAHEHLGRVVEIADRRAAIERALVEARRGDTVVIAGKGHETGQEIGELVVPFDDRAVAAEILAALVAGGDT